MVTAVCQRCEENFESPSGASLIEVDERDLAAVRRIFEGLKEPLICAACGCDSGVEPTVLLHTNHGAGAWIIEGGPWANNDRAKKIEDWTSAIEVRQFRNLTEMRSSLASRYEGFLYTLVEAEGKVREGTFGEWFSDHNERFGAESYVARELAKACLLPGSRQKLLSWLESDDPDLLLAKLQAYACIHACEPFRSLQFGARRLQECLDDLVFPGALEARVAGAFETFQAELAPSSPPSLKSAHEMTLAWLCYCLDVQNERLDEFTRAVLELELFATMAGGSLPLAAHACRFDPDRLRVMLDSEKLKDEISKIASDRPADALIETARRLGHPDAAQHLATHPLPDWLKRIRRPGVLGNMIMQNADGEVIATAEITPENALGPPDFVFPAENAVDDAQCDVFVSYSGHDRLKANLIAETLAASGLTIFMDHHTPAGDVFTRHLSQRLHTSRLVVVLWSRESLISEWVNEEARIAFKEGKIFQVLLAPVTVPAAYAHLQAASLKGWTNERDDPELNRLAKDICRALGIATLEPTAKASSGHIQRYEKLATAEAVLDWCNATAWHALAPATEQSLLPVGEAYDRIADALAPSGRADIHNLLNRFDLGRIVLLAALVTLCRGGSRESIAVWPNIRIAGSDEVAEVICEQPNVFIDSIVLALRTALRAKPVTPARVRATDEIVLKTEEGSTIELFPKTEDVAAVDRAVVRQPSRGIHPSARSPKSAT